MKALVTLALVVGFCGTINAYAGPLSEISARQAQQQNRISQGIASGALTPREAAVLETREARLSRIEARDLADGRLSPREACNLNWRLNRTSAAIYRDKHNWRYW